MTEKKEPKWYAHARSKSTEPTYPLVLIESIKKELGRDNPDMDYMCSKCEALKEFVGNCANFRQYNEK